MSKKKKTPNPYSVNQLIKNYDATKASFESGIQQPLPAEWPVICRLDLEHCKKFSRGFAEPYDEAFYNAMRQTLEYLCRHIHEIQFGFTTSDEISLLFMQKKPDMPVWQGYRPYKMCSILAATATMKFNRFFRQDVERLSNAGRPVQQYNHALEKGAVFDCRCFTVPFSRVCEYFIWRQEINRADAAFKFSRHKLSQDDSISSSPPPETYWRGTACIRQSNGRWLLDTNTPQFRRNEKYIIENTPLSLHVPVATIEDDEPKEPKNKKT